MKKKGFMKSVEAILTILFFMGIYVFLTQRVYSPAGDFERNPSRQGMVLLQSLDDSGILSQDLKSFDLRSVENKLYYLMPERFGYHSDSEYFSKITLNSTGGTWDDNTNSTINHFNQVLAFTYNFPEHVDKNSVQLLGQGYSFDRNVDWNWYRVPVYLITNSSSVENWVVEIVNLSLKTSGETVNSSSFVFQAGKELFMINDTNTSFFSDDMNVTVNVSIPFLTPNTKTLANFFYAGGATSFNSDNSGLNSNSLVSNASLAAVFTQAENSSRGDVQFFKPYSNNSKEEIFLSYSIGTSETNDYNTTLNSTHDNTDVSLSFNNEYRGGTPPIVKSIPGSNVYSVSRLVNMDGDYAKISLRMWYLW